MKQTKSGLIRIIVLGFAFILILNYSCTQQEWKPNTDWGHWILGQKSDLGFLKKNNMTVTFGSGAPNFDEVTREEFDVKMLEAKKFNKFYHDNGYIVLRYLSTSLNGNSISNKDIPTKDQINYLKFYNENWQEFEDYIGPKPIEDPTTWMMIRPDGTFPYYRYAPYGKETDSGFEAWGVQVNPYYIRLMEGKIRAQAETGIDGSYIDWTHIAEGTSYDKYSRLGFIDYLRKYLPVDVSNKKYGVLDYTDIKLPEKRGDKFWMEWITYRGYQVAEFHKRMRTVARKINPNFLISGNVFGGFGYGPIAYLGAGNIEMLGRDGYDDFIYSEMQEFLDSAPRNKDGIKITNSPALKYLTAVAHGKPVIIYATEITPPIFPNPTEKSLSLMAQINIAEAVANHSIFREKRETPQGATKIYKFLAENRQYLMGAQLYSNVGIMASLNQFLADEQSFAFSTSRILTDQGVNHTFFIENDLINSQLKQFDVIILPYLPLMSVQNQNVIIDFVKEGGNLFILGSTGIKNQYNLPNDRIPFLDVNELSEYPKEKMVKSLGKGKIIFLALQLPEHKFLTVQEIKNDATTFGSSMVNVFADVPEAYTRNNMHPELKKILNNLVNEIKSMFSDHLTILSNGLPFVELTTMRNTNQYILLHLVNYNVTIDGEMTPAKELSTQLALPNGSKVKRILYSGELGALSELNYEVKKLNDHDLVYVTFPELSIYGFAVVELE
jgi:hypothetical protein